MENQKEGNVMAVRSPRYSKEEFANRGDRIYETQVRHQVEARNYGKINAVLCIVSKFFYG